MRLERVCELVLPLNEEAERGGCLVLHRRDEHDVQGTWSRREDFLAQFELFLDEALDASERGLDALDVRGDHRHGVHRRGTGSLLRAEEFRELELELPVREQVRRVGKVLARLVERVSRCLQHGQLSGHLGVHRA